MTHVRGFHATRNGTPCQYAGAPTAEPLGTPCVYGCGPAGAVLTVLPVLDLWPFLTAEWDRREAQLRDCHGWSECDCEVGCPAHGAPAGELAQLTALRHVLDLHSDAGAGGLLEHTCRACARRGEFGRYAVSWPCPTVRALTVPYADRPGYNPQWKP